MAILLWAAMHDRSINWACQRKNWPMQAWRRRLPDQSTMSRRLRSESVQRFLLLLVVGLVVGNAPAAVAILDAKPLEVSEYSWDVQAKIGRGAGRYARGYKLHTLIDLQGRVLAMHVESMNVAEGRVARRLLRQACSSGLLAKHAVILADAGYDSNRLHRTCRHLGLHLIAPRRRPHCGLSKRHRHEPGRLLSTLITERLPAVWRPLRNARGNIERFFGALSSVGGGLHALPPWARGIHRVRLWVAAKLLIHAARTTLRLAPELPIAA